MDPDCGPSIEGVSGDEHVGKRTWLWGLGTTLVLALGAGLGAWAMQRQIRADLHHDLIWYRYLGSRGPVSPEDAQRFQGSLRWYPLTQSLLERWETSPEPLRRSYVRQVWETKGVSYARQWLQRQLRRNPEGVDLPDGFNRYDSPEAAALARYGLDDPATQYALIDLAIQHLDPTRSGWSQFNVEFIQTMAQLPGQQEATWRAVIDRVQALPPEQAQNLITIFPYRLDTLPPQLAAAIETLQQQLDAQRDPEPWQIEQELEEKLRSLPSPTPEALRAIYVQVSVDQRPYILRSLANGDTLTPAARILLQSIATEDGDPQQVLAATLLHQKGDRTGEALLRRVLNDDMERLHPLSSSYDGWLLMLHLAEAFPESRFTEACRAYGAIRGGDYFGDWHSYSDAPRPWSPAEEGERWQTWLQQYPEHPGADDATYWLARTWEWQDRPLEALRVVADWIVNPNGDRDMAYALRTRLYSLLDVGTSATDLETFLAEAPQHPLQPLITYALALRHARTHDYAQALSLTTNLTLDPVFRQYVQPSWPEWWEVTPLDPSLANQRQRWQSLGQIRDPYTLAVAWAAADGWRAGYFLPFQGSRAASLTYDPVLGADLERDAAPPTDPTRGLHQANHHAIALKLLAPLTESSQRSLRLRARYWQGVVLYRQFVSYPPAETQALVPLPGLPDAIGRDPALYVPRDSYFEPGDPYYAEWATQQEKNAWYVRQMIHLVEQISAEGRNDYGDDLLLALYEMTGDPQWPSRLLADYPRSSRAVEAEAVLSTLESSP